jgi:tetratricopeptide (TPR) repeat protein
MIGLMLGTYQIEVNGPTGKHIYSGERPAVAGDKQSLNVIHIDLALIPTKASLAPFKGAKAAEIQNAAWRKVSEKSPASLTLEQQAQIRAENAAIAKYNELVPEAQAALKAQDWPQAAGVLEKMIEVAPYMWELRQNLGTIQRNRQQFQDAVKALEKAMELIQEDAEAKKDPPKMNAEMAQIMISEGEAYSALQQPAAAAVQFRRAAALDPKPALALAHLCTAEYNAGHPDLALDACARAITAEPGRVELYQVMGSIQSNLDRPQEALATYDKGIAVALDEAREHAPVPRSNIISQHFSVPQQARLDLVHAGQMMLSAGNSYSQMRNYAKAAEYFTSATRLHPFPALPYFDLCAALYNLDNLPAAVSACDKATSLDPKMADAYYVKGIALYGHSSRKGKYRLPSAAAAALEKYLQLAPEGIYAAQAKTMLKEAGRAD